MTIELEEKSAPGPQETRDPGAKTAPGAPTAKKEEKRTHPFIPQNRRDGAEEPKPQRIGHPAFGQSVSRMSKSVQMWVCSNG